MGAYGLVCVLHTSIVIVDVGDLSDICVHVVLSDYDVGGFANRLWCTEVVGEVMV